MYNQVIPMINLDHDFYFFRGRLAFPLLFSISLITDLEDSDEEGEKGKSTEGITGFEGLTWSIISRLIQEDYNPFLFCSQVSIINTLQESKV